MTWWSVQMARRMAQPGIYQLNSTCALLKIRSLASKEFTSIKIKMNKRVDFIRIYPFTGLNITDIRIILVIMITLISRLPLKSTPLDMPSTLLLCQPLLLIELPLSTQIYSHLSMKYHQLRMSRNQINNKDWTSSKLNFSMNKNNKWRIANKNIEGSRQILYYNDRMIIKIRIAKLIMAMMK